MNKAVIFILEKDGQLLMEERSFARHKGVFVVFPGGIVEEGETEAEAVLREINEELGIDVQEYKPLSDLGYTSRNGRQVLSFLITKWNGKIPKRILDQDNPVFWQDIEALLNSPLKHIRDISRYVKNYLTKV